MGFLKLGTGGETRVDAWLQDVWGKMTVKTKLIDTDTVIMRFLSEKEVNNVLRCAKTLSSPFVVVDRWMEVTGSPQRPYWVRFHKDPLHAWREEVFRLLGDCLGATLEVYQLTSSKEMLTHGRVKVFMGKVCKLSVQIPLWVGNLQA